MSPSLSPSIVVAATSEPTVQHFVFGRWLLLVGLVIAVLGSLVGLSCARAAREAAGWRERQLWLAMGALSIGGVGVWLMRYVAMLGFAVEGTTVRFHPGWTLASLLVAVAGAYAALLALSRSVRLVWTVAAGLGLGLVLSVMQDTAGLALRLQGELVEDRDFLVASAVIALAGSTGALLCVVRLRRGGVGAGALVLGSTAVGMHYAGMASVEVLLAPGAPAPTGLELFTFLMPALVVGMLALAVPITALMLRGDAASVDLDRESAVLAAESSGHTHPAKPAALA